jgi:predicted dehydrogenase/threonine dehydrogenase-like Zn-dependent dehydrogenase
MKQVLQNMKNGQMDLQQVPPPTVRSRGVLVCTQASVISAGTERMVVELAKKSLLEKARERPDLVKRVFDKFIKEGFASTYKTVSNKLSESIQLGYSAAGIVVESGSECVDFKPGDRVAMAGAGYANHAEYNYVPRNLVAKIPDGVSFEQAGYTTIASIAMQGVRLGEPTIGDTVVVLGLGLIGLIAVQLLSAAGCRVVGVDLDERKIAKAKELGADAAFGLAGAEDAIRAYTNGHGCDLVVITAATKSNGPIELAGAIARRRGRVVVVGAVGMGVPRDPYYKKELDLKISMSYGPGRYDSFYEEEGNDYPFEFVRWTENRNMQSVLGLMQQGKLRVEDLTTHRFDFDKALDAYALLQTKSDYLGIVLDYQTLATAKPAKRIEFGPPISAPALDKLGVGFVGAGGYASVHLLPHVQNSKLTRLRGIACATGGSARSKAVKFGFDYCTTDFNELINDKTIDTVFIATRHDTHCSFTTQALQAGKSVFVEKPLAMNRSELATIVAAYQEANQKAPVGLMVGTNRRFSKMVQAIKEFIPAGVLQMHYRINPGPLPKDAWFQDSRHGGGMLVSEMCHFVDVLRFLAGSSITRVFASNNRVGDPQVNDYDNLVMVLQFENGSLGTVSYNTIGAKDLPKEFLQVFGSGKAAILTDFRNLELVGAGGRKLSASDQDKGQPNQVASTIDAFKARKRDVIPADEMFEVMSAIFCVQESLATGKTVDLSSQVISS